MSNRTIECHICTVKLSLKEKDPDPTNCPCCGADLQNKESETRKLITECDYAKSTFKSDVGTLVLTDKRLFWIKERLVIIANNLGALAAASLLSNRGADKVGFEVPVSEILSVQETKKGLVGKTFTIQTRDGSHYQFQPAKTDLQTWMKALSEIV